MDDLSQLQKDIEKCVLILYINTIKQGYAENCIPLFLPCEGTILKQYL